MSNDDDLYGDLYGNDDAADFPGFDKGESETKEPSKPAPAETVPTPAPAVKATTTTAETKPTPAPPVEKEEPQPVPKKEEPLTNPIPTFTEESGSSYFQGGNKYGQSSGITTNGNNYSAQTHGMGGGQLQSIQGVDGSDGGKSRDEGKMFVGGLNWDTTDDGLRNYFSQFGKIDSCTIMRDPAGRSRGFAFLTFEDPAAVNKVMVQEHYLDGKIIDPKRAIPRTEHQRTVKMFVGGLAPSVTSDSMREYFSQFGKVIDATVMVDRDSSRSKGFGFVTFDDQSGAERLFGMPGLQIDGKMIEVKMAQPRAGMAADRQNNNMNSRGGGGGGFGNNNFNGGGAAAVAGAGAGAAMGGAGSTPFDPQALATLYQRMAQLAGGAQGGMGWGMNNGMGMNMMGMGGGMGGGGMGMMGGGNMMGGGMGAAGGAGSGGGRHFNGGMNGGGMGMVDGGMGPGGGGGRGNIPRGPAAMRGGAAGGMNAPTGPSGGLGPARMGRGHQHNYHPYSR